MQSQNPTDKAIHPLILVSLVCGVASLLLWCASAIPGIIVGSIGLIKLRSEPTSYKGRGLGLWAIVLNCASLLGVGLILPALIGLLINAF